MDVFEKWESEVRGYCRAFPTVFESATNARQIDERGRSYIDFFAGAGVLNLGHNNERLKRAIIAFLDADGVTHSLDMSTTSKRAFIERFAELVLKPRNMNYKMQFTGPTGTNAVEAALKLARRVTGRRNIMAFSHGFHGMTLGSLACTANDYFRQAAGVPLEYVIRLPFETSPGGGLESLAEFKAALADASSGYERPAAYLVETIQAEGGVNVASQEWLHAVQRLAREQDALFIIDDIQVGCSRTGSYFSFDGMDLDPDIICLAKGIGGFGTPLAMNLVKPEHDAHWSPGEHTGTFRGQGLSFVAGREALSVLTDGDFLAEVDSKGKFMRNALLGIAAEHPNRSFEVRGRGMIQALDVGSGALAKSIAAACFDTGLLVGPCGTGGRVLKLIPPLTTPESDLKEGLDLFAAAVRKIARAS